MSLSTSSSQTLLSLIQGAIEAHDGGLGGATKLDGDQLQIFDGRVTLQANAETSLETEGMTILHCHVFATLHEFQDEVLDACVTGHGVDADKALGETAFKWMTGVAGPIRSFIDGRPVCMTCKTGVDGGNLEEGFSPDDYGLPRLHAYISPSLQTNFTDDDDTIAKADNLPWFQYAAESASASKVHLAKVTLEPQGEQGWQRHLEVDGHDVSHIQKNWLPNAPTQSSSVTVRYAVFSFPDDSGITPARAALDSAIESFIKICLECEEGDDPVEKMVAQGVDPALVDQVDTVSTLAFGRMFFEPHGVQYSPVIYLARCDGTLAERVPVMSLPAYNRGRAILARMAPEMAEEDTQRICLYGNESCAILQLLESGMEIGEIDLQPWLVVELGMSDQQIEDARITYREILTGGK